MANRYWVGGSGTWNSSSTTNWSAASGGTAGASAPTNVDNVIIDTNSGTGTITCTAGSAVCNDLTVTASQAITLTGSLFGTKGSLTYPVGGSFVASGLTYTNTSTSTINCNFGDKTAGAVTQFEGSGTVNLQSNFVGTTLNILAGIFNTNNYAINCSSRFGDNGSAGTRTLNFGSSTIDTNYWYLSNTAALTLNSGTSTINVKADSPAIFSGGGKTYYNVSFTDVSTTTIAITGANTFNNLSFTAPTSGTKSFTFDSTNTINGTLTTSGTTAAKRIQFSSSVSGTQRTLSVATIGTLTNTNWQDIALTGAASPWTAPLGVWDLGNNSGITFDTTTLYWIGGAGTWTDGTHWSTSSGGSAANVIPGPNNDAIFNASSGGGAITIASGSYCRTYNSTGATGSISYGGTNGDWRVYGSFILGASITTTLVQRDIYLAATSGSWNLTLNGKDISSNFYLGSVSTSTATWTLGSNFSSMGLVLVSGTFNTNNYTGTLFTTFSSTGNLTRAMNLGSSTFGFTGNNAINFSGTNFTFNAGTSTLSIYYGNSNNTIIADGYTFYNFTIPTSTASRTITFTGSMTFNNLTVGACGVAGYVFIPLSGNLTVNGTFTVSSSANGNRRNYIYTNTVGTQRTISAATTSLAYVDFYGISATGGGAWSGTSIGNGTLNSGITFTTPKTVYWNLAAGGNWMTSTAWATTSGGSASVANFPLPQDTANIVNTGLNASTVIYTGTTSVLLPNIDFSARTLAMTFDFNAASNVCGNVTYSSSVGFTSGSPQPLSFYGSTTMTFAGTQLLSSITVTSGANLTLAGTGAGNSNTSGLQNNGTVTLTADAFFTSGQLNLAGTTNLNTYTLYGKTCILGAASTTNFGTGKISLTGNNATIFTGNATQTVTGTPVIDFTYSGATGTRIISGDGTESNAISFNITAGTDSVTIGGTVKNLDFTGFSGTLTSRLGGSIYGNVTLSTGMTLTLNNSTTTFAGTSGIKTITSNGKTINGPIIFNGIGSTWQLVDNMSVVTSRLPSLSAGTLDLNGKTLTCGLFSINNTTSAKNITFNGGTISIIGTGSAGAGFSNQGPTGFTTTAGTGTGKISFSSGLTKTFAGGGSTYNCTIEQASSTALTVTGSNTIDNITNTVQPTSVLFTAGTTNTFNNFSLSGTSGNLVTIGSATTASHTLSKASGIVSVSYCTISYSTATGGALWQAYTINGNVNGGNNSGWLFSEFSANGLLFGSNF